MTKHEVCEQCGDSGEYEVTTVLENKTTYTWESCQECCQHGDYDHGICGICGYDNYDSLCGAAESLYEGDR